MKRFGRSLSYPDKLMDALIATRHIGDGEITNPKVAAGTLTYDRLTTNTIQVVIPLTQLGGASQSVAADAVGTPAFAHNRVILPTNILKHLKSAVLAVDYAWAATADGTLQLYDATAGVVRGESATKTGGESAEWETFTVTGLVEGNEIVVRANITAAGAAGETCTLYRALLILTLGVS